METIPTTTFQPYFLLHSCRTHLPYVYWGRYIGGIAAATPPILSKDKIGLPQYMYIEERLLGNCRRCSNILMLPDPWLTWRLWDWIISKKYYKNVRPQKNTICLDPKLKSYSFWMKGVHILLFKKTTNPNFDLIKRISKFVSLFRGDN
jgi:hypothetical protein